MARTVFKKYQKGGRDYRQRRKITGLGRQRLNAPTEIEFEFVCKSPQMMERGNLKQTDAILLCGGIGSRLREISGDLPKPLLDVGGKPLIQYSIDNLDIRYVRRLIFAVDYQAEKMQEWILSRNLPYSEIHFSYQTQPGVLPAITSALNFLVEDNFVTCDTDEIQLGFSLTEF